MSDVDELRFALHSLVRRLRAHRVSAELSETQYLLLGALERDGAASPARLAQEMLVKAQSLTPALNALAADGYVRRRQDDGDRRRQLVELTPSGRELVIADRESRDEWLREAMAERLTDLERSVVLLAAPVLAKLARS
jgi:DNA-binding MarR family transcriptional regulator